MDLSMKRKEKNGKRPDRLRTFLYNGLLLTLVSLFMRFVSMAFQLFITEHAGSESVGLYSVISGVYGFAVTLATSGIQLGTTRMISEALGRDDPTEAREARRVCLRYALFFGMLASVLLFFGAEPIGCLLLKDERTVLPFRILACSLLPIAISSVLNGYFTAVRRVYKNALCSVFEQGLRILITAILLLYVLPSGIESACIALVLGSAVSEILSVLFLGILFFFEQRRGKSGRSVTSRRTLRNRLCGIALPVAFSAYARSGLLTIEHMLIPICLTTFFGNRSAALSSFGILHGVVMPVVLFPSAILSSYSGLLVPEIAECRVREEREKVRRIVTAIFRGSLLFSVGISGIMLCFSYEIGSLLENPSEASYYLRMLAPLIPVMYFDNAVDSILKGHGEQVYCMQVNIIDSLLSVILIYLLLPKFGMEGYIFVIYITELLNASLSITRLLCVTDLKPSLSKMLFVPLSSVIGATAIVRMSAFLLSSSVFFISSGVGALVFHISFSIALYVGFLFLLGGIRKSDVLRFYRRIRHKKRMSESPQTVFLGDREKNQFFQKNFKKGA